MALKLVGSIKGPDDYPLQAGIHVPKDIFDKVQSCREKKIKEANPRWRQEYAKYYPNIPSKNLDEWPEKHYPATVGPIAKIQRLTTDFYAIRYAQERYTERYTLLHSKTKTNARRLMKECKGREDLSAWRDDKTKAGSA